MKPLYSAIDSGLLRHATLLGRMTESVRRRLPQHLAEHCWVAGCHKTCVTLITDNPAFTTLIYYYQHEVVKQLNEEFTADLECRLKKARVRVSRFPIQVTKN